MYQTGGSSMQITDSQLSPVRHEPNDNDKVATAIDDGNKCITPRVCRHSHEPQ